MQDPNSPNAIIITSKFNIVDLAGSESISKS